MDATLKSDDLEYVLSLPTGEWAFRTRRRDGPDLTGARYGIAWTRSGMRRSWEGDLHGARVTELGPGRGPDLMAGSLSIERGVDGEIGLNLQVSLGSDLPALFWRVQVENNSPDPIRLERVDMLRLGKQDGRARLSGAPARLRLQSGTPELAFFSNGWQSWSVAATVGRPDRPPRTCLGPLTLPMSRGAVARQPRGRGVFASEMFGVIGDRISRDGLLMGFLSQRETFGGLHVNLARSEPAIHIWAECDDVVVEPGSSFWTDWGYLQFVNLDEQEPLGGYLALVARQNRARLTAVPPVGWCSWYQFFQGVTEDDVYTNLEWAREHKRQVPLDVLQIDDGFAVEVGDWHETSPGFSSGLPAVSRRIRGAGMRPGIWLAPFVAKPAAKILREHPDWILRKPSGAPANAGFIWDAFTRALDVTHPEVQAHVEELMSTAVDEWGFDYLKLDFLYAGALRGVRHNPHVTRAQALRSMLERIRAACGEERFIVGCGCPLGSGIGVFDAMRIGPDVAPTWEPVYRGLSWVLRREPDLPSVRNAVHNVITRAPLHGRWWVNDPDCLILRGGSAGPALGANQTVPSDRARAEEVATRRSNRVPSRLTWDETKTLASVISLSGGSFFISDHLPDLSRGRLEWLARLLPPLPSGLRALDWFDEDHPRKLVLPLNGAAGEWFLVGLINWARTAADVSIDLRAIGAPTPLVHAVDFWNDSYFSTREDHLEARRIPPHGIRVFALRTRGGPQWLGDTFHISQGLAVKKTKHHGSGLDIDLDMGRRASGRAWLELPAPPNVVTFNGEAVEVEHVRNDVYVCRLAFEGAGSLKVRW
jgi:alpha-galactosidase